MSLQWWVIGVMVSLLLHLRVFLSAGMNPIQKRTADEFTLKVIEVNPTASYLVNDQFSVGFGLRGVYTDGVVRSDFPAATTSRDLSGDSIDFGYNLALSYKPIKDLTLAATYRSKVDLTVEGEATLTGSGGTSYLGRGASVTIPLPASLAISYGLYNG